MPTPAKTRSDHRGSWVPTWGMITTRFMELRRRRGLMIALIAVYIGIPAVFLTVRLISHAVDPKSFGPAGGYTIFTTLVLAFMYVFGFIVAAVVGCTAGSSDLTDGMFRHLVITGRSDSPSTSLAFPPDWPSSSPWWRSGTRSSAPCACSPPPPRTTTTG